MPPSSAKPLSESDVITLSALGVGRQGEYGAKTSIARQFGISRPTVYNKTRVAEAALKEAFFPPEDNARALARVVVDEAQLRRAIISAYVEGPNSIRDVQALLMSFYGLWISFGKIQMILADAQRAAAAFNAHVCLDRIKSAALDEMFSQGDPVLAGIDLDTGYVFLTDHRRGRSGDDWAEALNKRKEQGLELATVVKDAGTGLKAGVDKAFPQAQQRDDAFHALQMMTKQRRRMEKYAWSTMEGQLKAERELDKARRTPQPLQSATQKHRHANAKCEEAMAGHDQFEALMHEAAEAMQFIALDDLSPRRGEEQAMALEDVAARMDTMTGKKIKAVARYLRNRAPGLAVYMDDLGDALGRLAAEVGAEAVGLCCQLWRRAQEHAKASKWDKREHQRAALRLVQRLLTLLGDRAASVTHDVMAIIAKRHRASSAIESLNSLLRPYLYVHKGVSQGFLELFVAWRNLRTRPMGKHRGTSAYELLTGDKVDDWLTLLGYPPSASLTSR